MQESINTPNVVQAFRVITSHSSSSSSESIDLANKFLWQCQEKAHFATSLLKIYGESQDHPIQLQSMLLLTNIIKRNWNNKRGKKGLSPTIEMEKPLLRNGVIEAYSMHGMAHNKHVNQLIKYLVRMDYPLHFPQVQQFLESNLANILNLLVNNPHIYRGYLQSQSTSPVTTVLSTLKVIVKQYSLKRIVHNQQSFNKHMVKPIELAFQISQKLSQMVVNSNMLSENPSAFCKLVQNLKKIDKICLYAMASMPTSYQYRQQIGQLLGRIVKQASMFNSFLLNIKGQKQNQNIASMVETYLWGVIQLISRMQSSFPFLIAGILKSYLESIIQMLLAITTNIYTSDRLISTIVVANIKPLQTFAYYMDETEFKGSVYARNTAVNNIDIQKHCNSQYRSIYTPENVNQLLSKLMSEVMANKHVCPQNGHQPLFEDTQSITIGDSSYEPTPYENCTLLCKTIIKRFKEETKPYILNLLQEITTINPQNFSPSIRHVLDNSIQIVLALPSCYYESELPLEGIYSIMGVLYECKCYQLLARLIRKYHEHFNQTSQGKSYSFLVDIVSVDLQKTNMQYDVMYHCALSLKFLINDLDLTQYPQTNAKLPLCFSNIIKLISLQQFLRNPTKLWPMINLLIKLIKELPKQFNQQISKATVEGVMHIIRQQKNEQIVVCALCQLLSVICQFSCGSLKSGDEGIALVSGEVVVGVYEAIFTLIKVNISNECLQYLGNLHLLWLSTLRNYPTLQQQSNLNSPHFQTLNTNLKQLFLQHYNNLLEQQFIICLQLTQQYFMIGILEIDSSQLLQIFEVGYKIENIDQQKFVRYEYAMFSLYFTFVLLKMQTIPQILVMLVKRIVGSLYKISQHMNVFRSLLLMILDYHLLTTPFQSICSILQPHYDNVLPWFYPYLWSHEYVSNRLIFKLNIAAAMKSIKDVGHQEYARLLLGECYNGQYSMDHFLKTAYTELLPIKPAIARTCYNSLAKNFLPMANQYQKQSKLVSRRANLHTLPEVIQQVINMDLKTQFRNCMITLMKSINWGYDDITERVGENMAKKYKQLLQDNAL